MLLGSGKQLSSPVSRVVLPGGPVLGCGGGGGLGALGFNPSATCQLIEHLISSSLKLGYELALLGR